jgi:hypothetical protein
VRDTKENIGWNTKDPLLKNLALGEKILWRLVFGKKEGWKTSGVAHYNPLSLPTFISLLLYP